MAYGIAPEAAASGIVNAPVMAAADTVVLGASGLDAGEAALRAGTACVQPLPVGVEHVFDIILACWDTVPGSEYVPDMIPSFALDTDQVKVPVKVAVAQLGVRNFVEEGETVLSRFYRGEMNCRGGRRPIKVVTLFEIDGGEISPQFSDE